MTPAAPAVIIRPPLAGDAADIAALLGELGYPASTGATGRRLDRLSRQADVAVFVAELDATPVGFATAHVLVVIHADDPMAILSALVVSERHRGQGIGRSLVNAVEAWARQAGAYRITVASALAREGAHAFYERLGYRQAARWYAKLLAPGDPPAPAG